MNTKLKQAILVALVSTSIIPNVAFGATDVVVGKVIRVLATHNRWGNCMAYMNIKSPSLSCSNWVTFDCEGQLTGNSKSAANRKWDVAQLALVTKNRVRVEVDDSKKINGQCFANRFDLYNN